MKGRNIFGLMLFVLLLFLAVSSGMVSGRQSTERSETVGMNGGTAANAPWINIEVDTASNTGLFASVAIDPLTGATHISYYDAINHDLRYARSVGSGGNCGPDNSWICQTVDSEGYVGRYSSIAVSPVDGTVWIAYQDSSNGDLKYAKASSPWNWQIGTIDKVSTPLSVGWFTSLKLTADGSPFISYYLRNPINNDELRIAYLVDSGFPGNCGHGEDSALWQCDTIDAGKGVGEYTSLALDASGNTHIAYYNSGDGELWYATTSGSIKNCNNFWTCMRVDGGKVTDSNVGKFASLYMDNNNRFHIAYFDAANGTLKYAVDTKFTEGSCGLGSTARCFTIDSMPVSNHYSGVSMVEDAAGYPIIAYQSQTYSLNVARPVVALGLSASDRDGNCGPQTPLYTWYCETVVLPIGNFRNADFASIAVDSSGLATIAYKGSVTSSVTPSDGYLLVAYQRLQDFLPLVVSSQ